jgi:uncharacterized coiled-coil DUF342 family protein
MNGTPRTDELGHKCAETTYDPQGDCDLLWPFARQLETELAAVTEQRDGLRSGIDYASDQLHTVTEQRDRLTKSIEPLKYWRDISECDCSNSLPQGGCLRCDLDRILNNQ